MKNWRAVTWLVWVELRSKRKGAENEQADEKLHVAYNQLCACFCKTVIFCVCCRVALF